MSTVYQDLPVIREIQMMLNAVRGKYNYRWEYLSVDGKYGPISRNAVAQFKDSINITPANDNLTTDFLARLRQEFDSMPKFLNSTDDLVPCPSSLKDQYPIFKTVDIISDLFKNMNEFVDSELKYIKQTGRPKAGIIRRLSLHVSSFDQRFAQMQASIGTVEKNQSAIDTQRATIKQNENLARQASKGDFNTRSRNPVDTLRARTAQSTMDTAKKNIRAYQANLDRAKNSAQSIMNKIMDDLKKYDLVGKVDRAVQKVLPKGGQYGIGKVNIRVNAGGTLLTLVSLKDLICDLFTYENSDAWRAKATAHLYEFLDGMIIGFVSAILAEIIVIAGAAVVGAAGATGAIAVIIAVVAVVIAIAIGYFFDKHDISLSRAVVDYCADIVPAF